MSIPCSLKPPEERLEVKKLVLPLLGDLHRVPLQLTHSNDAAEDLDAKTVMRACENISSLRDTTQGTEGMLRILSNTFLNSRRVKKSHQEIPFIETSADDEQPISLYDAVSRLSSDVRNPEGQPIKKLGRLN
jgi:DNA-directed RNA polymerase specialized sigma24 family protein